MARPVTIGARESEIRELVERAQEGAHGLSLARTDPDKYGKVLKLLSEQGSYADIQKATGASYQTIAKIERTHAGTTEMWRKRAAAKSQIVADMVLERLLEKVDAGEKMSLKEGGILYGILADKGLTLAGEASAVVEHRSGVSVEDARKAIEAAQKRVKGEAIDV